VNSFIRASSKQSNNLEKFQGVFGIVLILGIAIGLSNNRKAIDWRLVGSGLGIQLILALFILKVPIGKTIFEVLGHLIEKVLSYSNQGAEFVFGSLVKKELMEKAFGPGNDFIFFFKIVPTIIYVAVLVNIAYHLGIMQKVIAIVAKIVHKLMNVSGSEALSNVSSIFVGQVEAQIMIKPYLKGMTKSELLASMAGSMACIAGGVMAVYIALGVKAEYLLAASLMAAPGALVISKIVWPETEKSETKGVVKLEIKKQHSNLLDAIAHGSSDGLKIGLNVLAMLIGFIALIYLCDAILGSFGRFLVFSLGMPQDVLGVKWTGLSLDYILGSFFSIFAWAMGVTSTETLTVGMLMGKKMVINEFVAYLNFSDIMKVNPLSNKSEIIASFALCGFANFSSIAIQVGGIGELAPERRTDLAKLGVKALICGTLASYLSATLAGIIFG
jgi:CNT family concentrative nucleoside transporter